MPTDDPMRMDEELDTVVPDSPNKPYDMRNVIRLVVDDGEFFEIHEHWAKNMVVGFSRLNGYAVGVVANQPAQLAGVLDIDASSKAARFVRTCDAFNIPLLTFTDVPGLPARAPSRSGAASSATAPSCSTPSPRRRCRRSPSSRARPTAAPTTSWPPSTCWPTSTSRGRRAEVAVMGPEGAVNIIYRRDIAGSPTPEQRRQKLIDDYKARFANPYAAAERGYVDDVIVPHETRPKVITALETLLTKRVQAPKRKHGNIPL